MQSRRVDTPSSALRGHGRGPLNLRETTVETTTRLDPRNAGMFADGAPGASLPGMVVGDAGLRAPRRHGWPARLFIGMSYVTAVGLGFGILGLGLFLAGNGRDMDLLPWVVPRMLLAGTWAVLQWRLAGEVRRFSRWGWYGAMAELGAATVVKLGFAAAGAWTLPMVAFNVVCMRYLWKRRADFDIDSGS